MQQNAVLNNALKQAVQLHQNGHLDQAEAIYRQLINQYPENPDPYNLLGTVYHQRGKQRIAIELIQKALKIGPKKAMFYNNLGNALRESGEAKEAEKAFRKAIRILPKFPSAMNNLGGCILASGNIPSAINVFQKTLKTAPDFYPARHNLGNAYYEKGENEKACECYRQVLSEHPEYTKSARNLSEAKKFSAKDNDFHTLETLAKRDDFKGKDKANVLFALAKAQEDLKETKTAFATYLKANKAHRDTFEFDLDEIAKEFKEIRGTINPDFYKANLGKGERSNKPIFVLGMPRSGTSLVEQILSSHKKIHGAGELYFVEKTNFYLIREKGENTFSDAFTDMPSDFLEKLGKDYLRQMKELGVKADFIVDKMPRNFIYTGLIKLMLPDAKIIHCMRSPQDTCLSIFKKYFVGEQKFGYDLKELAGFYNLYLDHMDYWADLMGDSLYHIQYENLIADQKGETEKLLAYCGLEWDEACMSFYETKRAVRTASTDQVRRPIYKSSLEAWRTYEEELKPLNAVLGVRS